MNAIFISGKRILLSPLEKRLHLDTCYKWFNDQEVIQYLLTDCMPTTYENEIKWFDDLCSDDRLIFAVETQGERKHIGNVGLHYINWINRNARTVTIIGDKDEWGKGFGTEAKRLLIAYAFNTLNLHKLSSYVIESNTPSLRINERCGFSIEGCLHEQVYRRGQYHNVIAFGLTKAEWRQKEQ